MSNPNSAERDQNRKADRKLRSQVGVENQMDGDGNTPNPDLKVEAGYQPPSTNLAPYADELKDALKASSKLFAKGDNGIREAWITVGEELAKLRKALGDDAANNNVYGDNVKLWTKQWVDSKEGKKAHPSFLSNLANANVRAASIWLFEQWDKPTVDVITSDDGEEVRKTYAAPSEVKVCRKQNNPAHCRDMYTRWLEAARASDKDKFDLDFVPERTATGAKSSGSAPRGDSYARKLTRLLEAALAEARQTALNNLARALKAEADLAVVTKERDDALAQLRAINADAFEPTTVEPYIDLTPADFTVIFEGDGIKNYRDARSGTMFAPTVAALPAPEKAQDGDDKAEGTDAAPDAEKPASKPRKAAAKAANGKAKKTAKPAKGKAGDEARQENVERKSREAKQHKSEEQPSDEI